MYISLFSCKKSNSVNWQVLQLNDSLMSNCGCSSILIKEYTHLQLSLISSSDTEFFKKDTYSVAVFSKDSGTCVLFVRHGDMLSKGKMCNFPKEILNWDLSNNKSVNVRISAKELQPCIPILSITNNTYSDLVLTKMEKEK